MQFMVACLLHSKIIKNSFLVIGVKLISDCRIKIIRTEDNAKLLSSFSAVKLEAYKTKFGVDNVKWRITK